MPVVYPTGVPVPVAVLGWDGTDFRALLVDAAHRLQIDVVDAAGIQNTLQSVATDRLIVRGEDQLFSMKEVLGMRIDAVISGANGWVGTGGVTAGEYWFPTTVVALDNSTAVTRITMALIHNGTTIEFHAEQRAFAIGERAVWSGWLSMDVGDSIRAYFAGGLAGDNCALRVCGYQMTVEV